MVRRSGRNDGQVFRLRLKGRAVINAEALLSIDSLFWQRKQSLNLFTSCFFAQPVRKLKDGVFWSTHAS